jgi:hypothetical protein
MPFTQTKYRKDRYRLILLGASGTQVLVVPTENGFALPEVEIPAFERVPENLRNEVSTHWNQDILCLSMLPPVSDTGPRYFAAEALREGVPTHNCVWLQMASLEQSSIAYSTDLQALHRWLARGADASHTSQKGPFAQPGWFEEVCAWVATQIEPLGLRMTGPFRQLNASATFSLLRFETNGPAIWFKAVGAPNVREFWISQYLARCSPAFVPRILAVREEWHAWLTTEAPGIQPTKDSEIKTWEIVARTLAHLQIASVGNSLQLIEAGCRDVRSSRLIDLISPFFEAMSEFMAQQTKLSPPPLSRQELVAVRNHLQEALSRYQSLDIPDTLGHLDFNPGNIIVLKDHCVLLDWAEAYVGPPLLTFEYLIEHLRRLQPEYEFSKSDLITAYQQYWQRFLTCSEMKEGLALSPLLAAFAYAVSFPAWRDKAQDHNPATHAYLRSLTRRMKREADALAGQRILCHR